MTQPVMPDFCWPVDTGCCAGWDEIDPATQDRAVSLATSVLRQLSGYRVGGCPITVRPCRDGCIQPFFATGADWVSDPARGWGPVLWGGTWINMGCGCTHDCSCTSVCEVTLPGPVGYVESVQVGTQTLDPSWYRIDNGNRLVWQGPPDMDCGWPLCQDMSAEVGADDTFAVTYLQALPVDALGAYAAGVLACEFVKACSGAKCRLPAGVTQVVRQGVAFTVAGGSFPDGKTGILEVDAWLRGVNPNALIQPSRVWSPDLRQPRTTLPT